jgi:hypothetical protein
MPAERHTRTPMVQRIPVEELEQAYGNGTDPVHFPSSR